MRFLIMVSLGLASAALLGCAPKSGDAPNTGLGNYDAKSVQPGTQGLFVTQQSAPLENGSVPQALQLPERASCAGLSTVEKLKYGYDPRAKVGDTFLHVSAFADTENGWSLSILSTIASVDATTLVVNGHYSDIAISPSPGFPVPSAIDERMTCTKGSTDDYPKCDVTVLTPIPSNGLTSLSCSFQIGDTTHWQGLAERGTFTLRSGTTVQALRVTQTYPVHIKCKKNDGPEQDYGDGVAQDVYIRTNDTVSPGPVSCYSNDAVYTYLTYAQTGGKTISTYKDEVVSAPVR